MIDMGKILVVDDSYLTRFLLAKILAGGGHEVVGEAGDGVEALEKVRDLRPDVVILDIIMPRMRGLETLREIREISPSTRVIICSGDTQDFTVRDAVQNGASGFIVKPFRKEGVLGEVDSVLAGTSR